MKNARKLEDLKAEYQPKLTCLVCNKSMEVPYGRWGDSGSCSRKCEKEIADARATEGDTKSA